MERLPYIDEHAISVDADREATWSALLHVLCRDPDAPTSVPPGFVLDESRRPERFALKGRHPFAAYRWVFELDEDDDAHTRLRSATWAAFPGLHGKIYRALVIGTGAHRVVVRMTLKHVASKADRGSAPDYSDVFEAPIPPGHSRSAEDAFRDVVGAEPSLAGSAVLWIHRHVLGFRLGPHSTPQHVIGWTIARSDADELVLAADGHLMRGELALRRDAQRFILTTRLRYHRRNAARAVWAVIGPVHRAIAPQLVTRIAAGPFEPARRSAS